MALLVSKLDTSKSLTKLHPLNMFAKYLTFPVLNFETFIALTCLFI